MDALIEFVEQTLAQRATPEPEFVLPDEPLEWAGHHFQRAMMILPAPPFSVTNEASTLDEARALLDAAIAEYIEHPAPEYILLARVDPGVGKTMRGVRVAEKLAGQGKRVLYAGPRHAFFQDVLKLAEHPEWWYEWLPRQEGNETTGKAQTCRYARQIQTWIEKGYDGMDFCSQLCGWKYINTTCGYHEQKRRKEPIIFGQHAHVFAHPLQFHVVIGDENPIGAFMHEWVIAADEVFPMGMEPEAELTHIMHALTALTLQAQGKRTFEGTELLTQLGGAERVLRACQEFRMQADALSFAPTVRSAEDIAAVTPFHLPAFTSLLIREAEAHLAKTEYPHRVILAKQKLLLLMRHHVSDQLPPHVVWLDGTAKPALLEACFQRPVKVVETKVKLRGRVVQIHDRANGKGTLREQDEAARAQLQKQIENIVLRAGYANPAVITYQSAVEAVAPNVPHLHFYAARGTNVFETCDALIVAGTPMPAIDAITKQARMIFFERMAAFDPRWSTRVVPYRYEAPDGTGRAYPVGGFWNDPDLQETLWLYREAELIQAAHRARPVQRACDIWLLTNLPVAELPPTELLSIQELFGAPDGVNAFLWDAAIYYARECAALRGYVTAVDLRDALAIDDATARKYLDLLIEKLGWQPAAVPSASGRGRPRRAARPDPARNAGP